MDKSMGYQQGFLKDNLWSQYLRLPTFGISGQDLSSGDGPENLTPLESFFKKVMLLLRGVA